ncbi:MAG: hypothetical protein LBI86_01875, partial [Treponema sp.]|nr:hypothetical protein [Treponema sp.]
IPDWRAEKRPDKSDRGVPVEKTGEGPPEGPVFFPPAGPPGVFFRALFRFRGKSDLPSPKSSTLGTRPPVNLPSILSLIIVKMILYVPAVLFWANILDKKS